MIAIRSLSKVSRVRVRVRPIVSTYTKAWTTLK